MNISSIEKQKMSSIRLSQLNTDLQGKLSKFDTLNDGALSIEEAVQGLVALQKQSNNYKRMLYLQIPIMILLLACMLGVNILAINITKEIQTSSPTNGFGTLTDRHNNPVMVSNFNKDIDLFDFLSTATASSYSDISTLQFGGFDNVPLLVLPIQAVIVNNTNEANITIGSSVTVTFSQGSFTIISNCIIEPNQNNTSRTCNLSFSVDMLNNNFVDENIKFILNESLNQLVLSKQRPLYSQKWSILDLFKPPIVQIQNKPVVPGACAAAGFNSRFSFG